MRFFQVILIIYTPELRLDTFSSFELIDVCVHQKIKNNYFFSESFLVEYILCHRLQDLGTDLNPQ
jgi:hypothetical protein